MKTVFNKFFKLSSTFRLVSLTKHLSLLFLGKKMIEDFLKIKSQEGQQHRRAHNG